MRGYFLSMAERVYGDATGKTAYRGAVTLARWILGTRPTELHPRHLQREVRLPGLRTAEQIQEAAAVLVTAGWLRPPTSQNRFGPRPRLLYSVNPQLA